MPCSPPLGNLLLTEEPYDTFGSKVSENTSAWANYFTWADFNGWSLRAHAAAEWIALASTLGAFLFSTSSHKEEAQCEHCREADISGSSNHDYVLVQQDSPTWRLQICEDFKKKPNHGWAFPFWLQQELRSPIVVATCLSRFTIDLNVIQKSHCNVLPLFMIIQLLAASVWVSWDYLDLLLPWLLTQIPKCQRWLKNMYHRKHAKHAEQRRVKES